MSNKFRDIRSVCESHLNNVQHLLNNNFKPKNESFSVCLIYFRTYVYWLILNVVYSSPMCMKCVARQCDTLTMLNCCCLVWNRGFNHAVRVSILNSYHYFIKFEILPKNTKLQLFQFDITFKGQKQYIQIMVLSDTQALLTLSSSAREYISISLYGPQAFFQTMALTIVN